MSGDLVWIMHLSALDTPANADSKTFVQFPRLSSMVIGNTKHTGYMVLGRVQRREERGESMTCIPIQIPRSKNLPAKAERNSTKVTPLVISDMHNMPFALECRSPSDRVSTDFTRALAPRHCD